MPGRKYMSHSSEDWFGKRSVQNSIKGGLVGTMVSRADAVKQYKKSEHKWRKELNALRKKNKMLYIISKNSSS